MTEGSVVRYISVKRPAAVQEMANRIEQTVIRDQVELFC